MNAKQYLNRARHIDKEINALLAEKERTRDRLTQITQSYTRSEVQVTKDPHKFDRLVELENLIDQKVNEQIQVKTEIIQTISALEDRYQRMVLSGYYISMKTWEQVAVDMHYSFQNVMRLRKVAIWEVQKIIDAGI